MYIYVMRDNEIHYASPAVVSHTYPNHTFAYHLNNGIIMLTIFSKSNQYFPTQTNE